MMKKFSILLVTIYLFASCKEVVPFDNTFYFANPQPIDDSEISSIPNKYHGLYMNSDSLFLKISDDLIINERITLFKINKSEMDSLMSEFYMKDSKLISKENNKLMATYRILKDSIEISINDIDTLFTFSSSQKAKRVHGKLVLSEKDSIYWKVKMLFLEKNNLFVKHLHSNEDLKKLDSITKIKSKVIDSTSYLITPSRNEFIQFFKINNFGYDEVFRKVK